MSRYISSVKPKKSGKTTKVKMAFGQIRPNDIENNGKKLGAPDTRKRVLFTGYPGGDAYSGVATNFKCINTLIDGAVDV